MCRYLVEFGGKYLEWSQVSDAPVTCLMDGVWDHGRVEGKR